jgi:hypothetical protein
MTTQPPTAEEQRLAEAKEFDARNLEDSTGDRTMNWRLWGTYLSDRQWGTVREDYSRYGSFWDYLSHDASRFRAYRWGEDGLAGFCDLKQRICFALALWNGHDPILKERLFGLTNPEGNHGEDVKEYYFHLDNTPTHSYAKWLYKYPQREFPYNELVRVNGRRKRDPHYSMEYELLDTGCFEGDCYFDVAVEFAKKSATDILIRIDVTNRGPKTAVAHVLPTLWFRNTWTWHENADKPSLREKEATDPGVSVIRCSPLTDDDDEKYAKQLGEMALYCLDPRELLFTENETNNRHLFGSDNASPYTKDAFHRYLVNGDRDAVNPARVGTKAAARYELDLAPGKTATIRLRLTGADAASPFGPDFDATFPTRLAEADEFYAKVNPFPVDADHRSIQRQAFAGMLWCKQLYHYVVADWLDGDGATVPPPEERLTGRNHRWRHYHSDDVLSMPDSWEYPWFASWDMAFHTIVLAMIDPEFAKGQLMILAREWQMNPDGQIPAYEGGFDDVNPPLHAWAAWRVYKIEAKMTGVRDRRFLKAIFDHCLLYATWWLNRKDPLDRNLFSGGFLGMDNIGIFDRDKVPQRYVLAQSDGTGWMGMFALVMLKIAIELAKEEPDYYDLGVKFLQNFVYIGDALNRYHSAEGGVGVWTTEDGFFYDALQPVDGGPMIPIKVRSFTGLVPLFAVETIDQKVFDRASDSGSDFERRLTWFLKKHPELLARVMKSPDLIEQVMNTDRACGPESPMFERNTKRMGLCLVDEDQLKAILRRLLDENEFLGQYGIRSVSKLYSGANIYEQPLEGTTYTLEYAPAESLTGMYGGNSNWRGPIWFPVNYLLIESLQKYHYWLGSDFTVECPTGSGRMMNLWEVAAEIERRVVAIFERDASGRRPVYGGTEVFQTDPHWRDYILFFEYFHGDNGAGLGASHQTGWTGLTAKLIQQLAEHASDTPVVEHD